MLLATVETKRRGRAVKHLRQQHRRTAEDGKKIDD